MNNLKKLCGLIEKGKKISETKSQTKNTMHMVVSSCNTMMNWGDEEVECCNVNESICKKWFIEVEAFLKAVNLKNLVEEYCNNELSGNFACFDKQLQNLENLYKISQFLNNKKVILKDKDFDKIVLNLASSEDMYRIYLCSYKNIIGYDIFKELMTNLLDKNYFNFNIIWGGCDFRFISKGKSPLTTQGKERLKYLNKRWLRCRKWCQNNWKWLIGLLCGGVVAISFTINQYKLIQIKQTAIQYNQITAILSNQ